MDNFTVCRHPLHFNDYRLPAPECDPMQVAASDAFDAASRYMDSKVWKDGEKVRDLHVGRNVRGNFCWVHVTVCRT